MNSYSQGVSFSYLIPKNGYLAAPVSPLSIRGVGFGAGIVGFETGFTFYNIPGLSLEDLPVKSEKPLTGPHFALMIPGQFALGLDFGGFELKFLAGGFGFYQFFPRINEGNLDRALIRYESWDVATSDMEMENKIGGGLMGGIEFSIPVNNQVSVTAGLHYLSGGSPSAIRGTYSGGLHGGMIETRQANFSDARTVFEGFEISFGVNFQ